MTPQPLARTAVMDLRHSTPPQVVSHQERRRVQEALHARARHLGWPDDAIAIMDDARGRTAATAHQRAGGHTRGAHVTLEHGGRSVSSDVTRLARHGADGSPLLDLWGSQGGVIADDEGREDPATVHGRLLVGWQGTVSAWARHTRHARLTAGLLHQAARGALA